MPDTLSRCLRSSGSGFIIDPSGVILTNAHVVVDATGRQAAQGITVTLQDGRIFEVRPLKGRVSIPTRECSPAMREVKE